MKLYEAYSVSYLNAHAGRTIQVEHVDNHVRRRRLPETRHGILFKADVHLPDQTSGAIYRGRGHGPAPRRRGSSRGKPWPRGRKKDRSTTGAHPRTPWWEPSPGDRSPPWASTPPGDRTTGPGRRMLARPLRLIPFPVLVFLGMWVRLSWHLPLLIWTLCPVPCSRIPLGMLPALGRPLATVAIPICKQHSREMLCNAIRCEKPLTIQLL